MPFGGSAIPKDCVICNGTAYKRTDYPDLFTAIGTAWQGATSPGADMFRVPDLRDRALYGAGSVVQLGATDGRSTGNRGGPSHYHAVNLNTDSKGGHGHTVSAMVPDYEEYYGSYAPTFMRGRYQTISTSSVANHNHSVNGQTSGGYDDDKPSYAGVTYCITLGMTPAA